MRRLLVLAVLAVALVAGGVLAAARSGDGLAQTTVEVDGVPLTIVAPAGTSGDRPGAVIVHGFAGSAALMLPFARTLAHNGYVVVLPDLAGHGASTRPMADPFSDVDTAVRVLRAQPGVDPYRTVLIGHSRGASAVVDYAGARQGIAATVALSLGAASVRLPRNLLVLYGQLEFPVFAAAAEETLRRRDPTATVATGHTYGLVENGTAVRADPVPAVEHVSILFSATAHEQALAWLDATVRPGAAGAVPQPAGRLWPAGLVLLGLLIGFVPLARVLLGAAPARQPSAAPTTSPGAESVPARVALAVVGGLGLGGLVGVVLPDPVAGLAVGGYAAVVLLAFGVGALAADALAARTLTARTLAARTLAAGGRERRPDWRVNPSLLLRGVLLAAYATAMVAVPVHIGVTWAAPNQARIVALLVVGIGVWALFAAAERASAGRWQLHAAVLGAAVMLLLGLAVTGLGPTFLVLVLALFTGLLAIGAAAAAVTRRLAAPTWLTSAVAACTVTWTVAAALPLA